MKHVTDNTPEYLERNPFPELHRPPLHITPTEQEHDQSNISSKNSGRFTTSHLSDSELYRANETSVLREVESGKTEKLSGREAISGKERAGLVRFTHLSRMRDAESCVGKHRRGVHD